MLGMFFWDTVYILQARAKSKT